MKRTIIAAVGLAAFTCAAIPAGLAARYPDLTLLESASYVLQRVETLVEERLLTSTPYDAREPLEAELANVRRIALDLAPELATLEPLLAAIALRDIVYRRVPVQPAPADFDYANLDRAVFLHLTDPAVGDLCGGIATTYLTLLKAFGIEGRFVGMFQDAVDAPDPVVSHASVEAFIDGRWIALDPTFNLSIHVDGRRIGWEEARALALSGEGVAFDTDGYALLPSGSAYDYGPPPTAAAMRHMIFAPATQGGEMIDLRTLPPEWNGSIHYADGRTFDQALSLTAHPVFTKLAW